MKPPRADDERLRRDFAAPSESAASRGECLDDEAIWEASRGALDAEQTKRLLAHTAVCPACSESWRMAREIQQSSGQTLDSRSVRSNRLHRALIGFGVAAAAILAIVVFTPVGDDPDRDRFRGGDSRAIESLLDEGKPLPRRSCVLRWAGGPPGTIYTVEVVLEDLTTIHRAEELETGEHTVPPAALADLAPGTPLLWRVDALLPDTSRVSSPVFRATLE